MRLGLLYSFVYVLRMVLEGRNLLSYLGIILSMAVGLVLHLLLVFVGIIDIYSRVVRNNKHRTTNKKVVIIQPKFKVVKITN